MVTWQLSGPALNTDHAAYLQDQTNYIWRNLDFALTIISSTFRQGNANLDMIQKIVLRKDVFQKVKDCKLHSSFKEIKHHFRDELFVNF